MVERKIANLSRPILKVRNYAIDYQWEQIMMKSYLEVVFNIFIIIIFQGTQQQNAIAVPIHTFLDAT